MRKQKQKNLEKVRIDSLGYGWIGIGTLENGKKVLVKWWLPGSVVDGKIVKQKKDYIELHITTVHSYDTTLMAENVRCPHYLFPYAAKKDIPLYKKGCGWCKRQAISYPKQLQLKYQMLTDSFRKNSACRMVDLPEVLPSPETFHYRNKIEFSFWTYRVWDDELTNSTERAGTFQEYTTVGFHQQWRFAQVVDIDQCFLVHPKMHTVFERMKQDLLDAWLPVYRIVQHTGLLRHMVIRMGIHTGQVLVNLSIASRRFLTHPEHKRIRDTLLLHWQEQHSMLWLVTTLIITENNGMADVVHPADATTTVVRWSGCIFEELHIDKQVMRFQVSPFSFFQTNTLGAELLFSSAKALLWPIRGTVLDLYCGSWTIGIVFNKLGIGNKLVGIEIVEQAIVDAEKNAIINGLVHDSSFFAGKVEQLVRDNRTVHSLLEDLELIIVDPPREGLHSNVVQFLIEYREKKKVTLLYISCNPITFARDLELLSAGGRQMNAMQPVDMFPQTYHVEMIGVLK